MIQQNKLLCSLLLVLIAAFALCSCSKNGSVPVTNVSDQFVGAYNGTFEEYENGRLDTIKKVSNYVITKSSANNINLISETSSPIGVVVGNSFTSNYTLNNGGTLYNVSISGKIVLGVLTESGTVQTTVGNSIISITFIATYVKQ